MFSFLWSLAFRSSQPPPLEDHQPPPLEEHPTGGPSHTASGPHNYKLPRPDLYPGPIDVAPADMPELFDVLLTDVDDNVLHNEISTALGSKTIVPAVNRLPLCRSACSLLRLATPCLAYISIALIFRRTIRCGSAKNHQQP